MSSQPTNIFPTPDNYLLDSSFITFGYPRPPDSHHPLYDAPTPTERLARFHAWVTGYYAHGIGLSFGNAVADTDISVEERTACTYIAPGLEPDGSDVLVARACGRVDIYTTLKDTVLYTGTQANADADADIDSQDSRRSRWAGVQMRVVWCERSIWPAVWCAQCFSDEVEASQKLGKQMRPVQVVRVPDANHFVSKPNYLTTQGLLHRIRHIGTIQREYYRRFSGTRIGQSFFAW